MSYGIFILRDRFRCHVKNVFRGFLRVAQAHRWRSLGFVLEIIAEAAVKDSFYFRISWRVSTSLAMQGRGEADVTEI